MAVEQTQARPGASPLAGGAALVTGAGSGIGRVIAVALAGEGMGLVLVGRTAGALDETARMAARPGGGGARVVAADLATEAGLEAVARAAPAGLRVLVHSAGLFLHGTVAATSAAGWEALAAVNLHAPMRLTAACLGALRGGGQVVFVNSTAGLRAGAGNGA